ncbi:MAG: RHS repeat protein [Nitrospira sp.]|nr:RHS repeat protein [Nitrospira sp.]MBH0184726.1 RHS repeat protein [Nitrospira sp.]
MTEEGVRNHFRPGASPPRSRFVQEMVPDTVILPQKMGQRLSQAIDEQGNVATYLYDAVGNLLTITGLMLIWEGACQMGVFDRGRR